MIIWLCVQLMAVSDEWVARKVPFQPEKPHDVKTSKDSNLVRAHTLQENLVKKNDSNHRNEIPQKATPSSDRFLSTPQQRALFLSWATPAASLSWDTCNSGSARWLNYHHRPRRGVVVVSATAEERSRKNRVRGAERTPIIVPLREEEPSAALVDRSALRRHYLIISWRVII